MDMALGLRTMVIPTANTDSLYNYSGTNSRREWTIHLQVRRDGMASAVQGAANLLAQTVSAACVFLL
jgi:anthranilate synthase component 1